MAGVNPTEDQRTRAAPQHIVQFPGPQGWERPEKLSAAEFTKVLVTATTDSDLWVNIYDNGQTIVDLHRDLHAAVRTFPSCVPSLGKIYAVFSEGQWCRAKITALAPALKILYIDFGNEELKSSKDLAWLPEKFKALPAQALRIRIVGLRQHHYEPDTILYLKPVFTADDGCVMAIVGPNLAEPQEPACSANLPLGE